MTREDQKERRAVHYVNDRPAERGILVNNTLTGILVVIMGSVWVSIDKMEENLSAAVAVQAGLAVQLQENKSSIQELKDDGKQFEREFREHLLKYDHNG